MRMPLDIAGGILGMSLLAGLFVFAAQSAPAHSAQGNEDSAAALPLNGTFRCEYYKAKGQEVSNVIGYEVTPASSGWNWIITVEDGTSLFFTQTAGQFCYVTQEEE